MNKHIIAKLIVLAFACYFHSAQAAVISIKLPGATSNYTTTVGSFFDAGIYISDVPDFGGFDFNLTFDSTKLSVLSLTSASVFRVSDDSDTEVFGNSLTSPGVFHFAETISGTSPLAAGLIIPAAPSTLLGTLHFEALNTGVNSLLGIAANPTPLVFDYNANTYAGSIQTALVTINQAPPLPPAAMPLPPSTLLYAPGLLALFGLRKSKAQKLAI